ncbi:transposon Tf2-9 polyprotein [Trichonephila clavipes]|nr:transposon Tf2-9 polyprotein [Trichonephila clavipes]
MEPPRIKLTSDLPIYQRAYRTSATSEAEINKQIKNLLAADAEPLPRIDSLLDKLNNAKFFSTIDLASGYWHIPLHDKDKEKLAFVTSEGYEIKEGCITPDNQNIETIKKLQPPKNVKQLQSFLGSVNVYNKFIDSYAKIREPLNQLLKKNKQWDWTAECQTAFELLKNKLITKPVLQIYDPKLPLHVFCDASLKAIGAILKQPDNSVTKFPPAYLLFDTLPYTPSLAQNQVYPPVEEARKLAKENTIKYHEKNKIKYDARFIDSPFEPGDLVIYEEFNYPNRRKLSPIFSGPYEIVQRLSDVNYEITKPNTLTKKPTEIVHVSKLRTYYPPEELKLSHE